jgi:hypothetical protein
VATLAADVANLTVEVDSLRGNQTATAVDGQQLAARLQQLQKQLHTLAAGLQQSGSGDIGVIITAVTAAAGGDNGGDSKDEEQLLILPGRRRQYSSSAPSLATVSAIPVMLVIVLPLF